MRTLTVLRIVSSLLVCSLLLSCTQRAPEVVPAARVAAPTSVVPLAKAPDQFFTSGDVRLRYRETGHGEPVIVLHGFTRSLEDWVGVGDSLAFDHRVIALDERGCGQSTRFTESARFGREMADDVVRLMDQLHISRAHLVGHSMGASVAANVAIRYPARVATASLLAPPSFPDSAAFAQRNAAWVADLDAGRGMVPMLNWLFPDWPDSAAVMASADAVTRNSSATLSAVLRSMGGLMVPEATVTTARVPMVAVVGTRDPLIVQTRWLASRWPGARLLEIPGADHGVIAGDPATLAAMRQLMRSAAATR